MQKKSNWIVGICVFLTVVIALYGLTSCWSAPTESERSATTVALIQTVVGQSPTPVDFAAVDKTAEMRGINLMHFYSTAETERHQTAVAETAAAASPTPKPSSTPKPSATASQMPSATAVEVSLTAVPTGTSSLVLTPVPAGTVQVVATAVMTAAIDLYNQNGVIVRLEPDGRIWMPNGNQGIQPGMEIIFTRPDIDPAGLGWARCLNAVEGELYYPNGEKSGKGNMISFYLALDGDYKYVVLNSFNGAFELALPNANGKCI